MGERGAGVILVDGQGRQYLPVAQSSDVPLETKIDPGTAFDTTRRFHVPADATNLAIVYTHDTGFPIGWLIITEGGWFAKSPRMLIQ